MADDPQQLQTPVSALHSTITASSRPAGAESSPSTETSLAAPDFDIIREVGRGGMGIVYQAFDRKRQRGVALKTFQRIDASALFRFKNEFRALADVTHPNLVQLFELISDGQTWFFTMEYVEGRHFLAHARGELQMSGNQPRLRELLRQLAEGVLALHDAGKLHRDIKPSNVLVTAAGRVVLLDFGLAADLEASGAYHGTDERGVGTAAYMSPEQALGLAMTPASDWYSVGVMLYEALTGRRPFVGERGQVLLNKQTGDAPAPSVLDPGIPPDLDRLCVELLHRKSEDRPTGRDIIRRLRCEAAPPSAVPQPRTLFVGREQHLQALRDALAAMRQGTAVTVLVQGRSGLGKSAMVQRFLAEAQTQDGAVVLAGRCFERESVPYKALDSLVDTLSQYLERLPASEAARLLPPDVAPLARLFPVLRSVTARADLPPGPVETPDQQELRRRGFAALRELLSRLSRRGPLVLFIDDLQWGDLDSALLLAELLRPPDPPVLLLIGAFRSEDTTTSPFLRSLFQSQENAPALDRRALSVDVLTPPEARALALTQLGEDSAAHAVAIAAESGGNPLFLYELVQSFQAARAPAAPRATGDIVLDKVLWARIERLPEGARHLLEVLAVAGRPLAQASASEAAGLDSEERTLLNVLRSGHLMRGTGPGRLDEIETYHDRIRETVVAHLPAETLTDCHRRLAVTLERTGQADPDTLAVHFLGAGERSTAGRYYALAAGRAADALAFERSANLYRLALDLQPQAGTAGRGLRTRLGEALANAGRGAEAALAFEAAASDAGADEALDLNRRAAYQYLISGHFDAGRAALCTVLSAVGMHLPATPLRAFLSLLFRRGWLRLRGLRFHARPSADLSPAERARLEICWATSTGLGVIDIIRAADFQTRCLLLALRAGDPFHIARSLALEAIFTAAGGWRTRKRTARLLEAGAALASRLADPYTDGVMKMAQGAAGFLEGRFRDALPLLVGADDIFRNQCTGVAWELDTCLTHRVVTLILTGQLGELSRLGPLRLREARARGDLYAATNLSAYVMPMVHLAADDPQAARAVAREAMVQWSQEGFHLQHLFALLSEVEVCLYEGDGLAAWNQLAAQWPAYTRSQLTHVQMPHGQALFARARSALAASAQVRDRRPFLIAAAQDARQLEKAASPWSQALAGLIRASMSLAQGHGQAARDRLAEASARLERLDGQLFASAARWCLGLLEGGKAGRRRQAEAEAWMTAQHIRNPGRMARALVPGIETCVSSSKEM